MQFGGGNNLFGASSNTGMGGNPALFGAQPTPGGGGANIFGGGFGGGAGFAAAKPPTVVPGFGGAGSTPFGSAAPTTQVGFNNPTTAFGTPGLSNSVVSPFGATGTMNGSGGGGTNMIPFQPFTSVQHKKGKNGRTTRQNVTYQNISMMPQYAKKSAEEIRSANMRGGGGGGGFQGMNSAPMTNTGFGAPKSSPFSAGAPTNAMTPATGTGFGFGAKTNTPISFGGGGFGMGGAATPSFNTTPTTPGMNFGSSTNTTAKPSGSGALNISFGGIGGNSVGSGIGSTAIGGFGGGGGGSGGFSISTGAPKKSNSTAGFSFGKTSNSNTGGFTMGGGSSLGGGINSSLGIGSSSSSIGIGSTSSGFGGLGSSGGSGAFSGLAMNPGQGPMGMGGGLTTSGSSMGHGGRYPYHTRSFAKLQHFLKDTTQETKFASSSPRKAGKMRDMDMIVTRTHLRPRMGAANAFTSPLARKIRTGGEGLFSSSNGPKGSQILLPDFSRPRKKLEIRPSNLKDGDDDDGCGDRERGSARSLTSRTGVRFQDVDSAHKIGDDSMSIPRTRDGNLPRAPSPPRRIDGDGSMMYIGLGSDEKSADTDRSHAYIEPVEESRDSFLQKHCNVTTSPHPSAARVVAARVPGSSKNKIDEQTFAPPTLGKEYERRGYYMIPDADYWNRCTEAQLKDQPTFVVGRDNVARIEFKFNSSRRFPFEYLAGKNLSDIIEIERDGKYPRVKCYPDKSDDNKTPARGTALNVPAIITLYNIEVPKSVSSKPREVIVEKFRSLVENKKRNGDARFDGYDVDSKALSMRVPHWTQYSIFEEEDGEDGDAKKGDTETSTLGG
eukprot:g468.t1